MLTASMGYTQEQIHEAFEKGYMSSQTGLTNPYIEGTLLHKLFQDGWRSARYERRQNEQTSR